MWQWSTGVFPINSSAGELHLCATSGTTCLRDEDCDAASGEVCGIGITLDPECRPELADAVSSGEACDDHDLPCYNGLCLGRDGSGGFEGLCYELCDPAREAADPTCPEGLVCRQIGIPIGIEPTTLDVCASPQPEVEADAEADAEAEAEP